MLICGRVDRFKVSPLGRNGDLSGERARDQKCLPLAHMSRFGPVSVRYPAIASKTELRRQAAGCGLCVATSAFGEWTGPYQWL
jgi:hypothetical protein